MSKFPNIAESIFSVMSQMANKHGAINLSQGFPNFPVDPKLIEITSNVLKQNVHQYYPSSGYALLREKIAALTHKSYNRKINPETEVLIAAGATQAIFTTIQAFISRNDEVIILDPSYDCYEMPILLVNAKAVRVEMNEDFSPNWNRISDAVNAKTRMIIINNPNNPSGKIWSEDDFEQLEKLTDLYSEILVLSDEVYEYITFGTKHLSVNERPKLRERSVIISSFGKSFHITGWKIGYAIGPEHLMREIKKVHQYLVFSVNSVAQAAISDYLDIIDCRSLSDFYLQKRDLFRSLLQSSRFKLLPCEGSYFQVASYDSIIHESDIDFTKRLITDHGVAAIPLSVFYESGKDNRLVRFCFAKDDDTLIEAARRLCKI